MFAKLLKYEFKSQRKLLTILSFAALGAGLVGGLAVWLLMNTLESVENTTAAAVGTVLSSLLLVGIVLAVAAYVFAVWILLLYRFYKHHFSQEGYLTFTLPVTTHQILLAAILNTAIWVLISGIVCFCAICMIISPVMYRLVSESGLELSMFLDAFREAFSYMEGGQIALQIFAGLVSGIYALVIPFACIAIGCVLTKKYRILTSFGIYYGVHLALSMISGVFSVIITVAGISAGNDGTGLLWLSILAPCLLQLGLTAGGYFLMHNLVDKKLNLP